LLGVNFNNVFTEASSGKRRFLSMKKSIIAGLLLFFTLFVGNAVASEHVASPSHTTEVTKSVQHAENHDKSIWELLKSFYKTTGIYAFTTPQEDVVNGEGEKVSSFHQTGVALL